MLEMGKGMREGHTHYVALTDRTNAQAIVRAVTV